jgi:hypothetical protein
MEAARARQTAMQPRPESDASTDAGGDKPHGESGGERTPAGSTYGDFHPTRRRQRPGEPYADDDDVPPLAPEDIAPPSPAR